MPHWIVPHSAVMSRAASEKRMTAQIRPEVMAGGWLAGSVMSNWIESPTLPVSGKPSVLVRASSRSSVVIEKIGAEPGSAFFESEL